ncbi:glycine cleavage system protein H [Conexibacter sp. DBS9H8]|uniref:glycine cleavage system protein H n=1 Tax=Conexibacter sp. DBS9H8 TaxID=2937801 RepID=UPI00200C76F8|nr:hypothetical protein [Conexibacter sp. DBS9H8]
MLTVAGYTLDPALRYEPATNVWVADLGDGRVRVGLDPLGAETSGDIVAVSFAASGAALAAGEAMAIIEAAKFVGPLAAPVPGRLAAVNPAVIDAPGQINADPYGAWLAELDGVPADRLAALVGGEAAITAWFADAVARFRAEGAIAQ